MQKEKPLILTLRLDEKSMTWFDDQRQLYFPPERNFMKAHLTLFHQLPNRPETHEYLKDIDRQSFTLQVTGLINLGAGVAYKIESEQLQELHNQLSANFAAFLIPQDRQPFRPHITILNKSTPESARMLISTLKKDFEPFTCTALGLDCWTYLAGPWRFEQTIIFQ